MSNKSKKTGAKDWYQDLRGEFGKISWPDRETLTRETVTVTVVSIVIGVIIAMLDMVLQYGISFLV